MFHFYRKKKRESIMTIIIVLWNDTFALDWLYCDIWQFHRSLKFSYSLTGISVSLVILHSTEKKEIFKFTFLLPLFVWTCPSSLFASQSEEVKLCVKLMLIFPLYKCINTKISPNIKQDANLIYVRFWIRLMCIYTAAKYRKLSH